MLRVLNNRPDVSAKTRNRLLQISLAYPMLEVVGNGAHPGLPVSVVQAVPVAIARAIVVISIRALTLQRPCPFTAGSLDVYHNPDTILL
jgi:hypothetical protein